jgi:hypothetical protein
MSEFCDFDNYFFGSAALKIPNETKEFAVGPDSLLFQTYSERFRTIVTKSQNWSKEDISEFCRTLTESEKV